MNAPQAALRRAAASRQAVIATQRQWTRHASTFVHRPPPPSGRGKWLGFAALFGASAAGVYYYPTLKGYLAPAPESTSESAEKTIPKADLQFEKQRKKAKSKEENRDQLSSQHLQVKSSWEHPGVYAWGSNVGKVIDPESNEKYVKQPRRIPFFDGQLLRDLKLTQSFGAAISEKGDLVQWGLGFSKDDPSPVPTLRGKDLVKIDVSMDRIVALSRSGNVYSIPASRDDQEGGLKEEQPKSSWSIWGSNGGTERINFRNLTPSGLGLRESVVDISSGQEHCLMRTSKGRVFAAAASALEFPSKGQMGIPGLSWANRPKGPYDQPYEIVALRNAEIEKIATGDYHSVALDKKGSVFTFGDNSLGQLGFDADVALQGRDTPMPLPLDKLYAGSELTPTVTSIAAGGSNTFVAVDAEAPAHLRESKALVPGRRPPQTTSDLWACGQGVYGTLGTGRWNHASPLPAKIQRLSALSEFDEKTNRVNPIKIKSLSVGTTHCSATLDNMTQTSTSDGAGANDINWGSDVMFWGGNEHYQLGTGKRTNLNTPAYIGALDGAEGPDGDFHRLCVTPRKTIRLDGGKGRKVTLEQKVECGKYVSAVYSAV